MDKKIVLTIDDDEKCSELVKAILEGTGKFMVFSALDSQQGLKVAKRIRLDLILLDIMMPCESGLSTLAKLKEDKNTTNIPVIMVSSLVDGVGIFEAGGLYGETYLGKPFSASFLIKKVEEVLKL